MITTLTPNETIAFLDGPSGQLEMAIHLQADSAKPWAVVCHPHPLFGGTMHNKVVTTLVKTFQALEMHTLRFNFRGVGKSMGQFDNGKGEVDDLLAVLSWLQEKQGMTTPTLAGFSFGAFIAASAAIQVPTKQLVTIAPPVINFAMQDFPAILCPWILVQGLKDEVVAADAVLAWAEKRDPKPTIITLENATHFFHGQLGRLKLELEKKLQV